MSKRPRGWTWDNGIGFEPLGEAPVVYGWDYFNKYQNYANTEQGRLITRLRCELVHRHLEDRHRYVILDVGIGSGQFVETMRERDWSVWGTDINPYGVGWLQERGWWWEGVPNEVRPNVLTFWDTLEHITHVGDLIGKIRPRYVFIAMPIYADEESVFKSKHYRPGEHCWYFTRFGLTRFMAGGGYVCLENNSKETELANREAIESFVFRRANP